GDKARWVYVVEGGNSGWHIGYQSLSDRGPWNREKLWYPHWPGQAAYITPPIANVANGPSGLTHDPGVGLPARYRGSFFLCEFRGGSASSGVLALRHAPMGAGFTLLDREQILWRVLPTDVEFGLDGGLYVSDWTEGWRQTGKGRLYRLALPGARRDPAVLESAKLLREGMTRRDAAELVALLGHRDQRVRLRAQFELAGRGERARLHEAAQRPEPRLSRIHALWALGQLGARGELDKVVPLLRDPDHEIRAQAAKVLGRAHVAKARKPLVELLRDRSPRVRFFAAIALGQLGSDAAADDLAELLRTNDGRDPFLRHAGILGLCGIADLRKLLAVGDDEASAVRLAVVVALRRRAAVEAARFLDDRDPLVVREAARAVYDTPIPGGLPHLASLLHRPDITDEHVLRRAIAANLRVGAAPGLDRLVRFATNRRAATDLRARALEALDRFAAPPARDFVLNLWRPVGKRTRPDAATAIAPHLADLLDDRADTVARATIRLIDRCKIATAGPALVDLVRDRKRTAALRTAALLTLDKLAHGKRAELAKLAASSRDSGLRSAGVRVLARTDPRGAVPVLAKLAQSGKSRRERQNALRTLGTVGDPSANAVLGTWFDRLRDGKVPAALQLEVREAIAARSDAAERQKRLGDLDHTRGTDPALSHTECLEGGDVGAGRSVFYDDKGSVSCQKCHSLNGHGGNAGPDLAGVGKRLTRAQILDSLLTPSKQIAPGWGTVVLALRDDSIVSGTVVREDDREIVVREGTGAERRVVKANIVERSPPTSPMPTLQGVLSKRRMRDLVAFLVSLEKAPKKRSGH
ncbi:MAG: HEAT repeat domain-containing protein, partial [Planctomycetes bacterium]|nr:HEAT repeat domain-containing protein [Planctomycetota bacterium]